jgi:hypothetical protein
MSRTVDLFIDTDRTLESLAGVLSEIVGVRFEPSPDRSRFVFRDGQVTGYLAAHDFLDDDDLPLSEFRYVISAAVAGAGDIGQSPEACCLRRVSSLWQEATGLPSLLVFDLEWAAPGDLDAEANELGAKP